MRILNPSLAVVAALLATFPAHGQIGGLIRQRVQQAAEKKIDEAIKKVECAITDEQCIAKAKADGKDVTIKTDTSAKGTGAAAAKLRPGEGAWANYDFVPGERPLLVEDFSKDVVGNFPKRFEFKSGNMEIVEWNGGRWLAGQDGEFFIPLPEVLPERFTIEFDLAGYGNAMRIHVSGKPDLYYQAIFFGQTYASLRSDDIDARGNFTPTTDVEPVKVRIAVDGRYVKAYVNEGRVVNVPNTNWERGNKLYVALNGWSADQRRMIANVRIAAGGKKLYDALVASGRVATQGIFFDTGSDRLRPESTPTLKEIGAMLTDHADLKLTIEGHTDNVGNAASNKELSEKRAAAVREYLVSTHKVDPARLTAVGLGDTKPGAPNTTPEGRQANRRVELVKS